VRYEAPTIYHSSFIEASSISDIGQSRAPAVGPATGPESGVEGASADTKFGRTIMNRNISRIISYFSESNYVLLLAKKDWTMHIAMHIAQAHKTHASNCHSNQ